MEGEEGRQKDRRKEQGREGCGFSDSVQTFSDSIQHI